LKNQNGKNHQPIENVNCISIIAMSVRAEFSTTLLKFVLNLTHFRVPNDPLKLC